MRKSPRERLENRAFFEFPYRHPVVRAAVRKFGNGAVDYVAWHPLEVTIGSGSFVRF